MHVKKNKITKISDRLMVWVSAGKFWGGVRQSYFTFTYVVNKAAKVQNETGPY